MRIGFISTRLAGADGVSLETTKLAAVCQQMGHAVFYCAGELDPGSPPGMLVPEMHFAHPTAKRIHDHAFNTQSPIPLRYASGTIVPNTQYPIPNPQSLISTISTISNAAAYLKTQLLAFLTDFQIDLVVAENIFAIPMQIPLGVALREALIETGTPAVAHHHDFYWERERFRTNCIPDILESAFPPDLPNLRHAVISSLAQRDLKARRGIDSIVIPNVFDFTDPAVSTSDTPPPKIDDYNADLRQAIGLSDDALFILQPTRVIPRKGIELSIELLSRLSPLPLRFAPGTIAAPPTPLHSGDYSRPSPLPLRFAPGTIVAPRPSLIITHPAGDEGMDYLYQLQEQAAAAGVDLRYVAGRFDSQRGATPDGKKIYSLWDAYPHADFVTYPSLYEGFGNALLETIYFRRPALVNRYSVYAADIGPLGFDFVEIDGKITDAAVAQTRHLLTNPERRQQMVEHNYELGRQHFSYTRLRTCLMDLFQT